MFCFSVRYNCNIVCFHDRIIEGGLTSYRALRRYEVFFPWGLVFCNATWNCMTRGLICRRVELGHPWLTLPQKRKKNFTFASTKPSLPEGCEYVLIWGCWLYQGVRMYRLQVVWMRPLYEMILSLLNPEQFCAVSLEAIWKWYFTQRFVAWGILYLCLLTERSFYLNVIGLHGKGDVAVYFIAWNWSNSDPLIHSAFF